jgi:hypothetical protein
VEGRTYRPGLIAPFTLVIVGILLLLNQVGCLSWDMWLLCGASGRLF